MTYAPWNADGVEVTETKRITLDAGAHLNRIQSKFTFAGNETIAAAAGLAIHKGADFQSLENGSILSVWDTPQDPTAGRIATGIIVGSKTAAQAERIDGQGLIIFPVHSGESLTYYAGSAWSKSDMPTQLAWNSYLESTLAQLHHPLRVTWEDKSPKKKGTP